MSKTDLEVVMSYNLDYADNDNRRRLIDTDMTYKHIQSGGRRGSPETNERRRTTVPPGPTQTTSSQSHSNKCFVTSGIDHDSAAGIEVTFGAHQRGAVRGQDFRCQTFRGQQSIAD